LNNSPGSWHFLAAPTSRLERMAKCPYCARPLRAGGIRCRACRRWVLGWPHLLFLVLLGFATVVGLLELLFRLTSNFGSE
jgi:hypothetical protein